MPMSVSWLRPKLRLARRNEGGLVLAALMDAEADGWMPPTVLYGRRRPRPLCGEDNAVYLSVELKPVDCSERLIR